MKKLIFGLLSFAALSVVSCDYNDPNEDKFGNDPQAGWVQFEEEGVTYYSVTPGSGTDAQFETSVPVVILNPLNRGVNLDGLTVSYTIEDVSGSSSFIVSQGNFTLEKGVVSASIPFTIPASAQVSCTEFLITLTSTNRTDVSVGFESNDILTHRVIVGSVNRDSFIGTYDVVQDEGGSISEYQSNVTAGAEPNELVLTNMYDGTPSSQTHVFINTDGTLSFPDFIENFLFTAGGDTGNVYLQGKRGVTSCQGMIGLTFDLRFGPSQADSAGPISVVMTKQ